MPYRNRARTSFGGTGRRRVASAVANRAARTAAFRAVRSVGIKMGYPRAPLATRGFFGPSRRSPQELKVVDTAQFNSDFDTTGTFTLVNGVATGTDFTDRIGRKVCWKSLLVQGHIINEGDPSTTNLCRIMIVYDSQPNGALPALTDVLTAATSTAPLNLNNRDRFRVLMDKRFALGSVSTTATQAVSDRTTALIHKYKKLNLETIFDATTAAIGSIQTGSIFCLTVGTVAAGTTYEFQGSIRLRFNDA